MSTASGSVPAFVRRRALRSAAAGAVLLEAVLVIATVIVLLVGMIYLHEVYDRQLQVIRAANAASLAYATHGCQGATAVLSPGDARVLGGGPSTRPNPGDLAAKARGQLGGPAGQALSKATQSSGLGLPQEVRTLGSVSVTGPLGAKGGLSAFQTTVRSSDLVLCNDPPRPGTIVTVFQEAIQFFHM
jgi:hypothetical protein